MTGADRVTNAIDLARPLDEGPWSVGGVAGAIAGAWAFARVGSRLTMVVMAADQHADKQLFDPVHFTDWLRPERCTSSETV